MLKKNELFFLIESNVIYYHFSPLKIFCDVSILPFILKAFKNTSLVTATMKSEKHIHPKTMPPTAKKLLVL